MHHIIDHITDELLTRLPSHSDAYTLEDLRKAGFPLFLIEKIHIELLRNLSESITLPETDWGSMKSERVHAAWQTFLATIETEVLLPDSYKRSVIENAVDEVTGQLVTPRRKLMELIFGTSETVRAEEIKKRSREFVVYPYLGRALMRYLERKNQPEIDKTKAALVLAQVDERMTGGYTPLKWCQLLEPWFELMGDEIDTTLVRRFFDDKAMAGKVLSFESAPDQIDRAGFIELLTAERSHDDHGQEGKPVVSSNPPDKKPATGEVRDRENEEEEVIFTLRDKALSAPDSGKEKQAARGKKENEEKTDKEPAPDSLQQKEGEENIPIWQKFLSADVQEEDRLLHNSVARKDEKQLAEERQSLLDTFVQPEIEQEEQTRDTESAAAKPFNEVRKLLEDKEKAFIRHIFNNDKSSYEETVDRLDKINNWREASGYLYRQVFKQQGVSLYSDEAIEFTDRLQRWYQKNS